MSSAERKNRESIDENSIKDYYFSQDSENREKELQKNTATDMKINFCLNFMLL